MRKFTPAHRRHTLCVSCMLLAGLAHSLTAQGAPSLTIYNDNFAVVRDTLNLKLDKGVNQISYQEITKQLEPDSVVFRPLDGGKPFRILEQNYLSLPVNEALLLNHFEGQTIDFEIERNDQTLVLPGKIIRSGLNAGTPIIELEGKTRFGLPGRPLFPALKNDTLLKPALNLKLESNTSGNVNAELAYLTAGLGWKADYNIIANEKNDKVDIIGWVTFDNQSGKSFAKANVKLMAGDVNKVAADNSAVRRERMTMMAADSGAQVTEKTVDEYHLYSIQRALDLNDGESKQVEFITAAGATAKTRYLYNGAQIDRRYRPNMEHIRNDPNYGTGSNPKVWIYREFKNSKDNGLGIPLPKGRVRFYQQGSDQQLEFLGENNVDHSAKDAMVSVYTGNAFDVSGERKRVDFNLNSRENRAQESFAITLKNSKTEAVTVTVVEELYRWSNWSIKDQSDPFTKTDSQTIEFETQLKPGQEKVVTYTVQYHW